MAEFEPCKAVTVVYAMQRARAIFGQDQLLSKIEDLPITTPGVNILLDVLSWLDCVGDQYEGWHRGVCWQSRWNGQCNLTAPLKVELCDTWL